MPNLTGHFRVLILGGTTEARRLAALLAAATSPTPALGGTSKAATYDNSAPLSTAGTRPPYTVITSLAGRTSKPLEIAGEVRTGGFGGVSGLVDYLRAERIDAVVDATHPFAATMTEHATQAAGRAGVPLLVLRRAGWDAQDGDDWHRVRDLAQAAALVPRLGDRVFLTTGRQSIAAFAGLHDVWFLSRSVERPAPPMPPRLDVILDRGPFTLDGERRLLENHHVNLLITKDSGGPAPKLAAARERGIPVIVVDRPPIPAVACKATVEEAAAWLETVAKR